MGKISVREIKHGSREYDLEVALRMKILRTPLGLSFKTEDLARESADIHLGAFRDDELLGCLMLTSYKDDTMKMRQVAVDASAQGLGIGKLLVEACEEQAIELGSLRIELSARETAIPFYKKLGYEIFGEPYEEVTIPHRMMGKTL